MNTIILLGDKNDTDIETLLLQKLKNDFDITFTNGHKLCSMDNGNPKLFIYATEHLCEIAAADTVLILKNRGNFCELSHIDSNTRVVIYSQNQPHINAVVNLTPKPQIISCGRLKGDTINFSSLSDESIVVSLQRSIIQLNGKQCDPMELVLDFRKDFKEYSLLAYGLISMLLQ